MNEPMDHQPDQEADGPLEDLLSPLKWMSPPRESQLANRAAVARELSRLAAVTDARPRWWRRSIPVPVPVAAGLAAVLLVSLAMSLQTAWRSLPTGGAPQMRPTEARETDRVGAPARSAIAGGGGGSRPAAGYYETEVYLCGLGRLSSESGYVVRKEQADD